MLGICTVTKSTYVSLLNRVAERLLQAEARRDGRVMAYWQSVEIWLKVRMYYAALNVRVPVTASGNGDERPRPSSGSVFGKPATTSATAETLARQGDQSRAADRKTWGEME